MLAKKYHGRYNLRYFSENTTPLSGSEVFSLIAMRSASTTRHGAYRRRETFSPVERTSNVEARNALHRRVLSALTFTSSFRYERPRSGHRPRTRARDGRTMDAKLMRWQQIIMTFGARVQIMSTSGCLLYTSPSPRDQRGSRMPSSA